MPNFIRKSLAIHASANTVVSGGATVFQSATGALTLTVGSTNYSIDLTGVTAQNSAITTAVVSALQTASVGTSVGTFSVQDSQDTNTSQREFKISSAGTSFQIQFTRQDETTTVSMTFLEPLEDKVMAIKAIDHERRDQRTFLNEGFDVSGESLNPMLTKMIPSNLRDQGLLKVTQMSKYSPYWQSDDGRMFEMNSFGSFKEINQSFERFQDSGNVFTRMHSGFGGILDYEQNRATQVFDSTKLISELPDSFGYHFEMTERLNEQLIADMLEQQEIAKAILEEMDKQNRHY